MNRFSNTWSLMKSSFAVLMQEKKLILFPILSGLFTLMIVASFILPFFMMDQHWSGIEFSEIPTWLVIISVFAFYFLSYGVMIFFNSATIISAIYVMRGGSPSLEKAMKLVMRRYSALLGWTLIASTVGLILNSVENQSDGFGKIFSGILGLSWTLASFLVLPILVIEGKGPVKSLKASSKMLKDSWGEQILGHFSFGLIFVILAIPMVGLVAMFFAVGEFYGIAALVVAGIYLTFLGVLQWVLQSIFVGTVYMYVRENKVPESFSVSQIGHAIR